MMALLRAMDRRDADWLAQQPADVRQEFVPLVAMRWATGIPDGAAAVMMLWLINQRVNRHLFDISTGHPDLCYRLLASCGLNKPLRHDWIKGPGQGANENKALRLLATHHPDANDDELHLLLSLHTRETFEQYVLECGMQKDEVKDYLKAYDKLA